MGDPRFRRAFRPGVDRVNSGTSCMLSSKSTQSTVPTGWPQKRSTRFPRLSRPAALELPRLSCVSPLHLYPFSFSFWYQYSYPQLKISEKNWPWRSAVPPPRVDRVNIGTTRVVVIKKCRRVPCQTGGREFPPGVGHVNSGTSCVSSSKSAESTVPNGWPPIPQ